VVDQAVNFFRDWRRLGSAGMEVRSMWLNGNDREEHGISDKLRMCEKPSG